jgi:hypothetical protein
LPGLEKGADALDGARSRFSAAAQIEDETGIAEGLAPKASRRRTVAAEEFFYLSKQVHCSLLILGATRLHMVSQRISYLSRHLPIFKRKIMKGDNAN